MPTKDEETNMNSFETDIKKYTDKTRLKTSERHDLKERISSYMEYHPLEKHVVQYTPISHESYKPFVWPFSIHNFSFQKMSSARLAGGFFVLCILVSLPFFAEKSVPGDVLYVIKTGVNETLETQFANSPYEKIELETKLMNRRITEARLLASEGKLTEEVKNQIAETVKGHTTAVQEGLVALREEDAESAAIAEISFNTSLEVQSAVLGADVSIQDNELVNSLLSVVQDARDGVTLSQETHSASYEALIAQVERETTRAFELFTTIKVSATEAEAQDIDRRLSDINRLTEESKQMSDTQREVSVDTLTNTLGLLQKLIMFMSDIDIREAVSLNNLVPVVLTNEERITLAHTNIEELSSLRDVVITRLTFITESSLLEKSQEALEQVDGFITEANTILSADTDVDIEHVEEIIVQTRELLQDTDTITQRYLSQNNILIDTATSTSTSTDPDNSLPDIGTTTVSEEIEVP